MGARLRQPQRTCRAARRSRHSRLPFHCRAAQRFAPRRRRLLRRPTRTGRAAGPRAFFLLRRRRRPGALGLHGADTRRVPPRPRTFEPRLLLFPLHLFALAAALADERFFAVVDDFSRPRHARELHQPHRYLHEYPRQRARQDVAPDRPRKEEGMTEVQVASRVPLDDYASLLGTGEIDELRALAKPLRGRSAQMVNSTAVGGGVAEILNRLVPLTEELDIKIRWDVMTGGNDFFEVTKAFHNALHGGPYHSRSEDFDIFLDRKSTRLNSSHVRISYAVFCLKKKIHSCLCV